MGDIRLPLRHFERSEKSFFACGQGLTLSPHVPRTSPLFSSVFHAASALSAPSRHLPLEGKAIKFGVSLPYDVFPRVGLSNICYTVLDEIMECIFGRFPSKRSHWEAVIISIIISFELYSEIFKREETMRGIKAFVILAMTTFYFPIVPWGKGTNLFVLDA